MRKSIVVYPFPILAHESTHQKQERGLGLVKISYQLLHYAEAVAGLNHNLRLRMKRVLVRLVKVMEQRLQRLFRRRRPFLLIRHKLRDMH